MKKQNKTPLVSIVMPVFNAEKYLAEAIESILRQTHEKWELIIVDDASQDNSFKIAQKFAKQNKSIKLFQNNRNLGVARTANKAIKKAKGKFIARMDADDIAYARRLKKQLDFLQSNPDHILVGAQCSLIDGKGKNIGEKNFPTDHETIYKEGFINLPIQQPSIMVNAQLLPKKFTWYDSKVNSAEEHELFFKLLQYGKIANLPDTLHKYRFHGENLSLQKPKKDFFQIFFTRLNAVVNYGYIPTFMTILINLVQFLVLLILPTNLIFPTFFFIRDLIKGSNKKSTGYFLAIQG